MNATALPSNSVERVCPVPSPSTATSASTGTAGGTDGFARLLDEATPTPTRDEAVTRTTARENDDKEAADPALRSGHSPDLRLLQHSTPAGISPTAARSKGAVATSKTIDAKSDPALGEAASVFGKLADSLLSKDAPKRSASDSDSPDSALHSMGLPLQAAQPAPTWDTTALLGAWSARPATDGAYAKASSDAAADANTTDPGAGSSIATRKGPIASPELAITGTQAAVDAPGKTPREKTSGGIAKSDVADEPRAVTRSENRAGSAMPMPVALAFLAPGYTGASSTNIATDGRIPASPGTPEFAPQLAAHITTFVRDGLQTARLELSPGDMGPLVVQIQLDGNAARVHLAAENAQTRQALEQAMPQLASSLRESGLTLSGGGVFEQPRQPQQQAQPGQGQTNSEDRQRGEGNPAATLASRESALGGITGSLARRHTGVVDLIA